MASKLVAVFVMCIVVVAALHLPKAQADESQYKSCFKTCLDECKSEGVQGQTTCEIKCDVDCDAKEVLAKLDQQKD